MVEKGAPYKFWRLHSPSRQYISGNIADNQAGFSVDRIWQLVAHVPLMAKVAFSRFFRQDQGCHEIFTRTRCEPGRADMLTGQTEIAVGLLVPKRFPVRRFCSCGQFLSAGSEAIVIQQFQRKLVSEFTAAGGRS